MNNNEELNVKVYDAKYVEYAHQLDIGTIISSKKELKVAVKGGYILLIDIKLPGKRRMDIKSLLNGYKFDENSKML
jgi:Methionyl-tRNA formyltransferase